MNRLRPALIGAFLCAACRTAPLPVTAPVPVAAPAPVQPRWEIFVGDQSGLRRLGTYPGELANPGDGHLVAAPLGPWTTSQAEAAAADLAKPHVTAVIARG